MMKYLLCLPLVLGFSIATAQEPVPPADVSAIINAIQQEMQPADDLSGIEIPFLHSKKLEKKWGKPNISKSPGGGYNLQYHNPDPDSPFEYVNILGVSEVIPPLSSVPPEKVVAEVNGELGEIEKPQTWKSFSAKWKAPKGKVTKALRYYRVDSGGGADGPRDRTNAFSLTLNGKTGYYVVTIESITVTADKRLKVLEISAEP